MVCLSGPRRRVGPVIRVDVTDPGGRAEWQLPTATLLAHARSHADEVALICYTEEPGVPEVLTVLMVALESDDTVVLDAIMVRGGRTTSVPRPTRWNSGRHGHPEADDYLPGTDDPQVRAITAATALHGRGVLADRAALRASIAGPTGPGAAKASAALHAAADGLLGAVGTAGPSDRRRLQAMATAAVDRAMREAVAGGGITVATAAQLGLLLCDIAIRDELIARAVTEPEPPWLPMLIGVAAATPDQNAAQVCAVLAVAAYRNGDGALAQVAADRCLAAEPGHRLAHLMLAVMAAGLPPAELAHLATAGGNLGPGTLDPRAIDPEPPGPGVLSPGTAG